MIYILFVIYQSKFVLKEKYFSLNNNDFHVVVFDNSFEKNYLEENQEYCLTHNIHYLTEGKNIGLSKAYNRVIKDYIKEDDYLMILDADSNIEVSYLLSLKENLIPTHREIEVFSPININSKTKEIDSPLKITFNPFFNSTKVDFKENNYDYFKVINNGLLIKGSALKKINGFDENIFLYFSDSYLSFALYEKGIKTFVTDYQNNCEFSFDYLEHKALKRRLRLMKRDGRYFYKTIYRRLGKPSILGLIHYQLFSIKKAKECSSTTSKKYFLSYLFSGKEKKT
jgi:GT2 family glycosyltransferase